MTTIFVTAIIITQNIIYLSMTSHFTVCSYDPFNQKDINALSKLINQLQAILCCLVGRQPSRKEKRESL